MTEKGFDICIPTSHSVAGACFCWQWLMGCIMYAYCSLLTVPSVTLHSS